MGNSSSPNSNSTTSTVAIWDQIWSHHWYSDLHRRRSRATAKVQSITSALASLASSQQRICEIGCGSGHFLAEVVKVMPGAIEISGCDQSSAAISIASETVKGLPVGRLVVCDASRTPFPSKYFDVAFAICVLEHIFDKEDVLDEIARILKDDGVLIVFYSNLRSSFSWERKWKSAFTRWQFGYQDEVGPNELRSLLRPTFFLESLNVLQADWDFPVLSMFDRMINLFDRMWGRYLFALLRKKQ